MSMHANLIAKAKAFVRGGTRLRAFTAAFGLTVVGTITSFVAFMTVGPAVTGLFGDPLPDLAYKFTMRGTQWGFAAFALAYLFVTGNWRRYARFRRPGLEDGAWIVAGVLGLRWMVEVEQVMLSAVGLSLATISGTAGRVVPLSSWPLAWPLVFAGLYLVPAMAEEQFYRGLIQTRLRSTYSSVSTVLLAAGFYSLSHQLYVVGGSPEMIATYALHLFGQGLVFCVVYERTDNLLASATVHALSWASAYGVLTGLIGL